MSINTLELPRTLFLVADDPDDDTKTIEIVRAPLQGRLAAIEERQRTAKLYDFVFALSVLCLTLVFTLGIAK